MSYFKLKRTDSWEIFDIKDRNGKEQGIVSFSDIGNPKITFHYIMTPDSLREIIFLVDEKSNQLSKMLEDE